MRGKNTCRRVEPPLAKERPHRGIGLDIIDRKTVEPELLELQLG